MDTIYIIDNSFIFNPSAHTLQKIDDIETINLAVSASLCFTILIENQGQIILRHELLNSVWGSRGMNVATNTLYQNISLLRKSLTRLGVDTAMIQTAPRRGFLFDKNVVVRKDTAGTKRIDMATSSDALKVENVNLLERIKLDKKMSTATEKNDANILPRHYKSIFFSFIGICLLLIVIIIAAHASNFESFSVNNSRYISSNSGMITTGITYKDSYMGNSKDNNFLCQGQYVPSMIKNHQSDLLYHGSIYSLYCPPHPPRYQVW
ncbi:winged helix-turn-helix domain-containing protein [Pluralibacter gergoviae]